MSTVAEKGRGVGWGGVGIGGGRVWVVVLDREGFGRLMAGLEPTWCCGEVEAPRGLLDKQMNV